MRSRKTALVAAAAAIAATGVMTQGASAQTFKAGNPAIGYFYGGSESGRELHGGFCDSSGNYYGGYLTVWDPGSPTEFPGDFEGSCPSNATDLTAGAELPQPVEDALGNLPQPATPANPGVGHARVDDPSGLVLGDGGGVVVGNPKDRLLEVGICNKNTTGGLDGYHHGYLVPGPNGDIGTRSDGCSTDPPIVLGRDATSVASTTAVLNTTINPNRLRTTYYFQVRAAGDAAWTQLGSVKAIGDYAPPGESYYDRSQNVSGLAPGGTYEYRVVASNQKGTIGSVGGLTEGPVVSFTTSSP